MRLRADIWVKAYVRGCAAKGAFATVARHGDDEAGAVFIKVNCLDGSARVYGPAPSRLTSDDGIGRRWAPHLAEPGTTERAADDYLGRQADYDSDLWIIEVEDREGRHFLDDWLDRDRP